MMETASPRRSEREMPERIGIGPRGVAYSLVRFVASSKADPTPILTAAASWSGDAAQLQNQRQAGRFVGGLCFTLVISSSAIRLRRVCPSAPGTVERSAVTPAA